MWFSASPGSMIIWEKTHLGIRADAFSQVATHNLFFIVCCQIMFWRFGIMYVYNLQTCTSAGSPRHSQPCIKMN